MCLLITGAAGFIGFHLAKSQLEIGTIVIGIDNLNDYYDVSLKKARLALLTNFANFYFYPVDICDNQAIEMIFVKHKPQYVVHMAAQAGVLHSLTNPQAYVMANVLGFTQVIEACQKYKVEHLVYASSSSVYGGNATLPYSESDAINHPLTIYAATKKTNELIAHAYSHLYKLPTTGLRFFTVYGPWGRPDMAFFSFTRDILNGKTIKVHNYGEMQRDFTYIDDIVAGISLAINKIANPNPNWSAKTPDAASSSAPYQIYNIGCGKPVNLLAYIEAIEAATGKKAIKDFLPIQAGEVLATSANTDKLEKELGYLPKIGFKEGIRRFVDWYISYYD